MEISIFKGDAKQIVDVAFNARLFKDELTRDDFNTFEELIAYLLESRYDSYKRMDKLLDTIEKRVEKENLKH